MVQKILCFSDPNIHTLILSLTPLTRLSPFFVSFLSSSSKLKSLSFFVVLNFVSLAFFSSAAPSILISCFYLDFFNMQEPSLGVMGSIGGGGGGDVSDQLMKAEIATHPLCEQLLAAHVSCLRVATPVDQLPLIDAQLAQYHHVLRAYASQQNNNHSLSPRERQELDNFLAHYLIVLCTFKEQLQQHVRVHAVEAVMACREIENTLQALTGVSLGEGTGATMSDDEEELHMDFSLDQSASDSHDLMGFGPLLPTETERSLMERVRQELKIELKQGFKSKIEDVREEILRKRRAGKLPGDTTTVLKNWWQQHSKWPYPTEDDKAKLVEETGLQLKQINNWFINQRKRNWHSNSQSVTSLKSKRKR